MTICYISNVDLSLPNGPGVNESEFIVELKKELGKNVIFIVPKPDSNITLDIENVHYYRSVISSSRINYYMRIIFVSLAQIIIFHRVSQHKRFDLVLFRLDYSCVVCAMYLKMRRQAYTIKTLGNKGFRKGENEDGLWKFVRRKILSNLFEKSVRWAIGVDVCTPQYEKYYSDWIPKSRIRIVENVVNIKKFYPMRKSDVRKKLNLEDFKKIVGYIGGSPSDRGARQLVEISPKLMQQYPECGIVIVGEDSGLYELKKRTKKLGTENIFVWCGTVPYDQAPYYINSFDVGIGLDTKERVNRIGNASQKIRQYLACGVPVICPTETNLFVEKEGLGCLVDVEDVEEIFSALDRYFKFSEDDIRRFAERAVKYVKDNLSTTAGVKARLEFWKSRLESRR